MVRLLVADVLAAACACFVDADLGQLRQERLELLPDPFREVLAGRILETGNVIQIVVVEAFIERLEYRFDFGEITYPAGMRINIALQIDSDLEGMAMQATAFVSLGYMRKPMGRLESEFLENFHVCSNL